MANLKCPVKLTAHSKFSHSVNLFTHHNWWRGPNTNVQVKKRSPCSRFEPCSEYVANWPMMECKMSVFSKLAHPTRMYSNRMYTIHCSGHRRGFLPEGCLPREVCMTAPDRCYCLFETGLLNNTRWG